MTRRKSFFGSLSPSAKLGACLLGLFCFAALFGPFLAPHSPSQGSLEARLLGPSSTHWLGTDENGVDLLSAMLHGARTAFLISACVVAISATVGTILGTLSGYYGGWVDEVTMRVVDILLSFPGILLNLAIVSVMKRPGIGLIIFALTINGWVGYARLARGQALSLRERDYVVAARALGAKPWRIVRVHVIPNLLSPMIVQMTFAFGGVILVEAALSFLGLGPQVYYTWGSLLDQGTSQLWHTQRLATVPGAAIAMVVLGCNLLGDGLRDRLDPRRAR